MSNDLVEPTTDDEAIKAKTTPAQARAYERAVADYIATLEPGASVTWNFKRTGVVNRGRRRWRERCGGGALPPVVQPPA